VYYPTLLGVPIIVGAVLGWRKPERRALWILLAAVLALVLLDFAFDDTRFEDIPFYVVVGLCLFGLDFSRVRSRRRWRGDAGPRFSRRYVETTPSCSSANSVTDSVVAPALLQKSQTPTTISHGGMRSDPRKPIGVSCVAPRTMVAHASQLGSIPLRRAPSPVASSTAAHAALNVSQSYEWSWLSA
jgi:hypothetical protein